MARLQVVVVLVMVLAATLSTFSARTKKVTAEYLYQLPENVTMDEARSIAIDRARAQAIADEFGSIVTQSSSVVVENYNDVSNTDFLSIGGSELKGEWLEDTVAPEFEYYTDGGQFAIKVKIRGIIREIDGCSVPFDVKILNSGTDDGNESEMFRNGDQLYVSFNSPTAGYIAIYLVDGVRNAYCLLPYQGQSDGYCGIKANRRYVFFDPKRAVDVDKKDVDEYLLETEQRRERNRIITVFSPKRFYKAADKKNDTELPRMLTYADFQRWLSGVKKRDPQLTVTEKAILITRGE